MRSVRLSQCNAYFTLIPFRLNPVLTMLRRSALQWFSIPFAMSNEAFTTLDVSQNDWLGSIESHWAGVWFDYAMLLICGGIPWQVRTPD